jgi:hypothetical protein
MDRNFNAHLALQAHRETLRLYRALYAAAEIAWKHWYEFGPEHGFGECMDRIERELAALGALTEQKFDKKQVFDMLGRMFDEERKPRK